MRRPNKVLADLLSVLSGSLAAQAIGFVTLVVAARTLGPIEFGRLSVFIAVFTIAIQVTDFGFSTSIAKHGSDLIRLKQNYKGYIGAVLLFRATVASIVGFIIVVYKADISPALFGSEEDPRVLAVIGVAMPFSAIFFSIVAHYQATQQFRKYSAMSVVNQALRFVLVVLVLYLVPRPSVTALSVAYVVPFVIIAIIIALENALHYRVFCVDVRGFVESLKLGFWAFISALFSTLIMRMDILLLQQLSSPVEVGLYSASAQFAMVFPLVTSAIVATLLPKASEYIELYSVREYRSKVYASSKYVIIATTLAVLLAPMLLEMTIGERYLGSAGALQVLFLAYGIGAISNPLILIFYAAGKPFVITSVLCVQMIINFIISLALIPELNSIGAALASVLSRIVALSIFVWLIVRLERRI